MSTKFNANKYAEVSVVTDRFSDFGSNMDIHPGTGDISRLKNENAVIQSVRNLLLTDYYERPFAPMVGCRLRQMLFEDVSPQSTVLIQTSIQNTLKNYEPRINLLETIVEPNYDDNGYNIRLRFTLINSTTPVEIGFFLDRTR